MRKQAFTLAAVLACALVPATAGLLLAQAGAAPPPGTPATPGQAYYDPDFDRQQGQAPPQPGQPANSDGLLTDLFSDPSQQGQPQPYQGQPAQGAGGTGVLSLPGVESPVSTPAGPGEAVVERQGQTQMARPGVPGVAPGSGQAAGAGQPPTAAPVRRARSYRRATPKWPTSPWVKQVYDGAENAWRLGHVPKRCQTLVNGRLVYNIRCVSKPRLIGKPLPPYKDNPSVYYIWP
ncbi:MAG: hypothetical protein LBQ79_08760 [Deltaproteobacteria bacterium]|jgi:hypothetical protein|nr:hypothetical protein [Deltaproteobacteria bacterium]